jgi:hypothetical protein
VLRLRSHEASRSGCSAGDAKKRCEAGTTWPWLVSGMGSHGSDRTETEETTDRMRCLGGVGAGWGGRRAA